MVVVDWSYFIFIASFPWKILYYIIVHCTRLHLHRYSYYSIDDNIELRMAFVTNIADYFVVTKIASSLRRGYSRGSPPMIITVDDIWILKILQFYVAGLFVWFIYLTCAKGLNGNFTLLLRHSFRTCLEFNLVSLDIPVALKLLVKYV